MVKPVSCCEIDEDSTIPDLGRIRADRRKR
jgi:hypothetical protein